MNEWLFIFCFGLAIGLMIGSGFTMLECYRVYDGCSFQQANIENQWWDKPEYQKIFNDTKGVFYNESRD